MKNALHLALRYSSDKSFSTIDKHLEVIKDNDYVWWGKFGNEGFGVNKLQIFEEQLSQDIKTYVYLFELNTKTYKAELLQFTQSFDDIDSEYLPEYYRKDAPKKCELYLKLTNFVELDRIEAIASLRMANKPDEIGGFHNALKGQTSRFYVLESDTELTEILEYANEHKKDSFTSDFNIPKKNSDTQPQSKENFLKELNNQTYFSENQTFISQVMNIFNEYKDEQFWGLYYLDNEVRLDIGNFNIIKITSDYISFVIDSVALDMKDFEFFLKELDKDLINIYHGDFEDLIKVHIHSKISEYEERTLLETLQFAISKIFTDTYTYPKENTDIKLLDKFGITYIKENEELEIENNLNKKEKEVIEIDEKIMTLLSGEKETIEYKNTIINNESGKQFIGNIMFDMAVKAIAGFGNSKTGGSLLIGIEDNKISESTGLHVVNTNFYKRLTKQFGNEDSFLINLGQDLKNTFIDSKLFLGTLKYEFLSIDDGSKSKFLRIYVPSSKEPIYVRQTCPDNKFVKSYGKMTEHFFVRFSNNSTERFSTEETFKYIATRFPAYFASLTPS